MTSRLSYEEIRRLARAWAADAREQSEQDDAEVAAWVRQSRKDSPWYFRENLTGFDWWFYDSRIFSRSSTDSGGFDAGDSGGDSDGD